VLVSAVVEWAAGEPFGGFMAREVFQPLEVTRTVVAETPRCLSDARAARVRRVHDVRAGLTVSPLQLAGEPVRMVSHRGSPMGGTASLLTFPDRWLAVAVTANVADAGGASPFALQVAEAFSRAAEP
jgi:CubicO group peptidase (beta-lactamase class C family)